MPWFLTDNREN